jgi:hypothetical protein
MRLGTEAIFFILSLTGETGLIFINLASDAACAPDVWRERCRAVSGFVSSKLTIRKNGRPDN